MGLGWGGVMKEEIMSMDGRENREKEGRKEGREGGREGGRGRGREGESTLVEAISKGDWWVIRKSVTYLSSLFLQISHKKGVRSNCRRFGRRRRHPSNCSSF